MPSQPSFGELLYSRRVMRRSSQQALASAARVARSYVCALENGRRRAPPEAAARRLADALALSGTERAELLDAAQRERALASHKQLPPHLCDLVRAIRQNSELIAPARARTILGDLLRETAM